MGIQIHDRPVAVWRLILVLLAICALTIGLAMRFCAPPNDVLGTTHSVKTNPPAGKRQHLDRDAISWVQPAASFVMLHDTAYLHSGIPESTGLPNPEFDESLHNRPPPIALLA